MKKRITSVLLCLCMLAALMPVLSSSAEASTNGHSQSDAVAWTKKQVGKYLDYDGHYGAQCWDLAKYYYVYLGNGKYCKGNATTFVSNQLPPGWTRDKTPRPGDLCVWKGGTKGGPGWTVHPYGHIGIVIAVNGGKLTTVEQNINGSPCKQTTRTASNVSCFIHPDFTPVNYLTIQYNANGGTVSSAKYTATSTGLITSDTSTSTSRWANGQGDTTYGLANATTFGLSREGYTFAGWCLDKDGSGTVYDQDDLTLTSSQIYPGVKNASATVTMYAVWEYYTGGSHTHSANYKLGYCEICGAWLPNQDNSASVKCGQYEFKKDSADNILVDYPYSLARTYGTLYTTFSGGDVVEVIGAVTNGIGNLWYRLRDDDGNVGYASSAMLTPLAETASHTHSLSHVAAEDADCFSSGHFEYWTCSGCGRVFSDAQGNNETTIEEQTIFVLEHVYVDGVCERCGLIDPDYTGDVDPDVEEDREGAQEDGTEPADDPTPSDPAEDPVVEPDPGHTHKLSSVKAVEPTCTAAGQQAYWECSECGLLFSDAQGQNETALDALKVPALGHNYQNGVCTRCGAEDPGAKPEPGQANPFVDVPDGAYYYDPVLWAFYAQPQITDGMDDTHFGPGQTVTRGQAVTFLWRSVGKPTPKSSYCPFTDIKTSDYYYQPVLWALEQGITDGTSATTFSPNATLTRAHIITFLWRTTGRPGDTGAGQWYDDAVNWARTGGFLDGTAEAFAPNANCPRSDVVTYLYRADQKGALKPADPTYDFVLDNCSWSQAFQKAKAAGGHLVRIETKAEYDTIREQINQRGLEYVMFRVGARRDENGTDFYWVDDSNKPAGQPLNNALDQIGAQWGTGEPSLKWNGTEETAVEFEFSTGVWVWNDIADQPNLAPNDNYGYIIEY